MFRWRGGRIIKDMTSEIGHRNGFTQHSIATIFTQYPDTTHLLAVAFDVQTRNVAEDYGGWKVLSFDHISQSGTQNTYSSIGVAGAHQQLAAPGAPHWMPQLVPGIYDFNPHQAFQRATSAGLIGHLPILFALPAFSAPPYLLPNVLTNHLQPNTWVPHNHPNGCKSDPPSPLDAVDTNKSDRGTWYGSHDLPGSIQ